MRLSVVLPTYNRCAAVTRCLESLYEQNLSRDLYEVIVVVDGSADDTANVLRHRFRNFTSLLLLEQRNLGQSAACNTGARLAKGEIVLFLDDDFVCDSSLLSIHYAAHSLEAGKLVFGRVVPGSVTPNSPVDIAEARSLNAHYERLTHDPCPRFPMDAWAGPNCSMATSDFLSNGGYDEVGFPRRGMDVDLGVRLWKAGLRFEFAPKAIVRHLGRKPIVRLWEDAVEDGACVLRIVEKYPELRPRLGFASAIARRSIKRFLIVPAVTLEPISKAACALCVSVLDYLPRGRNLENVSQWLLTSGLTLAMIAGARRYAGSWRALRMHVGPNVAVLLYHHIGFETPHSKRESLTVSTNAFEKHVRWLHLRGYQAITPTDWIAWRTQGLSLPRKPVMLTFDDGYADVIRNATPILHRYCFKAALFVITELTRQNATWEGLPLAREDELAACEDDGIEIGGHSETHPNLTSLDASQALREISDCRHALINAGVPARSFAYPYGEYDSKVRSVAEGVFELAFTCDEGLNDLGTDPLRMRRTMVQPNDTLIDIELRAALGSSPLNRIRSTLRIRSRFRGLLRRTRNFVSERS